MQFRPCIDIHNGSVKQIVGSSLLDEGDRAQENFVAEQDAAFYANLYRRHGIRGGHVILLNKEGSEYFPKTQEQALKALEAFPGGLQLGGGVTDENAPYYLKKGASHVIVTSYVFDGGRVRYENLERLVKAVGKERIVLDLSCKRYEDGYYVMTDRWQKKTDVLLSLQTMTELSGFCAEFLVHAVDVEGKAQGIENALVQMLGRIETMPVTYAGGVHSFEDLCKLKNLGNNRVNVTIGSALDLFGGTMKWADVLRYVNE